MILSLSYLWLPYMVLPIYAGLDRLPPSLLDASGDLGARPLRTFRSVVMPMLVPSIAAGSLFTFSLSLGDFIIPNIVTEGKVRLVGKFIESTLNAPNQPLAAAITLWPLLIIVVYLVGLKRARRRSRACDPVNVSTSARWVLRLVTWFGLAFLYVPLSWSSRSSASTP